MEVFLTGFGPFAGVERNPTETILEQFQQAVKDDPIEGVDVRICTVLETSAVGAAEGVKTLCAQCTVPDTSSVSVPTRRLFLHCGVNANATSFALEKQAFNEANFRVPDQRDFKPLCQPIVAEHGAVDCILTTQIDVESLCEKLCDCGFKCVVSTDAGRYVCNYLYYLSLNSCASVGADCLFLHVPPFSVYDLASQLSFLRALLSELCARVQ
eukprot:GILK01006962.1.p1 GENE.GILK01006962.1~~GILK01006962.1.p1  ORF type:complete len:225 (+),score=24.40 GILK01006962.1:41-676(+)